MVYDLLLVFLYHFHVCINYIITSLLFFFPLVWVHLFHSSSNLKVVYMGPCNLTLVLSHFYISNLSLIVTFSWKCSLYNAWHILIIVHFLCLLTALDNIVWRKLLVWMSPLIHVAAPPDCPSQCIPCWSLCARVWN